MARWLNCKYFISVISWLNKLHNPIWEQHVKIYLRKKKREEKKMDIAWSFCMIFYQKIFLYVLFKIIISWVLGMNVQVHTIMNGEMECREFYLFSSF